MILAWMMSEDDGGAFFFSDRKSTIFCPICGTLLDRAYLPQGVSPRKRLDICSTYENRILVNDRFRRWCVEHITSALVFRQVNSNPAYYHLEPVEIVRFDSVRAKTRFLDKCSRCGNYESVVGIDPPGLLDVHGPIEEGMFRTDLEFGSRWEKSPLIVIGVRTKELMEPMGFRGLDFREIQDQS
jgi:hypothetical protein